jgi:plastocyanin
MSIQRLPWSLPRPRRSLRSLQRPSWPVVVLLIVAVVSMAGWAVTALRTPAVRQVAATPATNPPAGVAPHQHGGTANRTPPVAPTNGVVAITVPELPKDAVNFIWRPEHVLVARGQEVTFKVANGDYMQHNFTFKPAKVAKSLPVDTTTTVRFTAPGRPGTYWFYCRYHLQMMEGAITVR